MKKPVLIIKDNLLMPIQATERRISEINKEMASTGNPVILNGLFLMAVSYIESMQKEVLKYYLTYEPRKIPSKKTIEVDKNTLIENEDFHLIERLVSEYIEKMPYWQLTTTFFEALKVKRPDNNQILESIKKRRNDLIHDNLQVNYKHKTVNHKHINSDYLAYSLNEYSNYLNSLKMELSRRYGKFTKLNALMSLWHYTFSTPLCANFEDYRHIDVERDSISGYKISEREHNLSHSEKFMLGIWRSQVSTGKLEFINMASLGSHMQSCLYMFLKLSNNIFLY